MYEIVRTVIVISIIGAAAIVLFSCLTAAGRADGHMDSELKTLPDGATCDMEPPNKIVQCAECKRKIAFYRTYPSTKIISVQGTSYMVCPKCFDKELR